MLGGKSKLEVLPLAASRIEASVAREAASGQIDYVPLGGGVLPPLRSRLIRACTSR